ncbi:MAG: UdgX family uracil-DNA binding protein [Hyphomicrobiaceae bacterium]|nr:UdgX family uracil-DNA binding protein [Hyphomicrobiaceae bacterium]
MSRLVVLPAEADFAGWREKARALLQARVRPEETVWTVAGRGEGGDLFAERADVAVAAASSGTISVPRAFVDMAKFVICHNAADRFALLYRILWRLLDDKHLMEIAADADVQRAEALAKAVRRDKHKMTAFVRFREAVTEDGSVWIAWFEPEHHIVEATAPFFVRRFANMKWSILTPGTSAHWDGEELVFTTGSVRADAPSADALEDYWRVYFASIFNPARLNTAAMQREMPKKYWKNMPEAGLIPDLVRGATQRTNAMLLNPPPPPRVAAQDRRAVMQRSQQQVESPDGDPLSWRNFDAQLTGCRRCPLWRNATQAVPGTGPRSADVMLVGEQPGDQEDLQGEPFVGPAGKLLDRALEAAGLPRGAIYLTNAVKHFKFEPRGKRRLHKKPNGSEIDVCRWWLASEIKLVQPKLIVALGATAASSLLQRPVKISAERGLPIALPEGAQALLTVHPSYLLRLPDPEVAELERRRFVHDLKRARSLANDLGAEFKAA